MIVPQFAPLSVRRVKDYGAAASEAEDTRYRPDHNTTNYRTLTTDQVDDLVLLYTHRKCRKMLPPL